MGSVELQPFWELSLGATIHSNGVKFQVWAPLYDHMQCEVVDLGVFDMTKDTEGYFSVDLKEAQDKDCYYYILNGHQRPDPVSRFFPESVHGPSQIINPFFSWTDSDWQGFIWEEAIFYELHVGTFTKEGSYEAISKKLDYLKNLGINVIELMPLASFPGRWNWGYDGVNLYAPYNGYGSVEDLKTLVNLCHEKKMGVCLDIVYNHLGPEGNYLKEFGPYFSKKYHTPWGETFNFDDQGSEHVRRYIIQNALYWIVEYHIDALRLDAVHGIYDSSAFPILEELSYAVEAVSQKMNRKVYLIAETDQRDVRLLYSKEQGGCHFQALWSDDFHHSVHVTVTGEKHHYYADFSGITDVIKVFQKLSFFEGQASCFLGKKLGRKATGLAFNRFIAFLQNHDQVGNRSLGERLSVLLENKKLYPLYFLHLLSPFIPLFFMGEEYGEKRPFEYFTDFTDPLLMQKVHDGRKREFTLEHMPYPGEDSFHRSHLSWDMDEAFLNHIQTLLRLRKQYLSPYRIFPEDIEIIQIEPHLCLHIVYYKACLHLIVNLGDYEAELNHKFEDPHFLYSVGEYRLEPQFKIQAASALLIQDRSRLPNDKMKGEYENEER